MKFTQTTLIFTITALLTLQLTQAQNTASKSIIDAIKVDSRLSNSFKEKASSVLFVNDTLPPWMLTRNFDVKRFKQIVTSFEESALKGEGKELIPVKSINNTRLKFPGDNKEALASRLKYYADLMRKAYQ